MRVDNFLGKLLTMVFLFQVACCQYATAGISIENGKILLDVEEERGCFTRLIDKTSGVELKIPEKIADNFRIIVLKPDKKTSCIYGRDQKLASFKNAGDTLELKWKSPLKDPEGVEYHIDAQMDIAVDDSGALRFGFRAINNTEYKIKEIWYPFVGGFKNFGASEKEPDASIWVPTTIPIEKPVKFPFGDNAYGYPGHMVMPFICIQSNSLGKSIYAASYDFIGRYKVFHFLENSSAGEEDVFACVQHMPFTPAGGTFEGSIFELRVLDGGWQSGGKVYREWFEKTFGITKPSDDWIRRESFFFFVMFKLPEGTINYTFKDIPMLARAAKEAGINSFQISGWQVGGHDNGYPYYIPDPQLGTWEDLEEGIKYIHSLGMRAYFFVNYQPMMTNSDWYLNELHKYREMNEDGSLTWNTGWGMGTLQARMGNPKLMTWADLAFPEFRKIITEQFERLAKIGADGVHVDKMFPTALSFNPNSPLSPDTCTWEGAILQTKEIMEACRKHKPDWAMSFECNWDRMLQFSGASWWVGLKLIARQVFPEHAETTGIAQAYDFLGINNLVRDGHIIMLVPRNFCRGLEWPPVSKLAKYVKEIKRIRDRLKDTVFFGEILGKAGIDLRIESPLNYNVFRSLTDGQRVCIVTNSSMQRQFVEIKSFENQAISKVRIHTTFKKANIIELPARIEIPEEGIVFVEELMEERNEK